MSRTPGGCRARGGGLSQETPVKAQAVKPKTPGQGWLEQFGDGLYAYALRRVGRSETAEDLVQETLLAAMQAWASFDGRAEPRTWLTAILRRKVADHLRGRYRSADPSKGVPDASAHFEEDHLFDRRGRWKMKVPAWCGDPHRLAEDREFRQVLDSCMTQLPRRMVYLFTARVQGDVPTAQLCDELEITPENAWTLLHRARLRLGRCLTLQWFEPAKKRRPMKTL